jgi:P-type Ca2+ transporter type 2C
VHAVEQGRIIYANIQKAVGYLLTASLAAVATVSMGVVFDAGLPLTALQLLWLNLIMHIFPGLGIVMQKANAGIMNEPPRRQGRRIIGRHQLVQIIARSLAVSVMVLLAIDLALRSGSGESERTTIGLATLALSLLFQAFAWLNVSEAATSQRLPPINAPMVINMAVAFAMLAAAIYLPGLNTILQTIPPSPHELLIITACSVSSVIVAALASFLATGLYRRFKP